MSAEGRTIHSEKIQIDPGESKQTINTTPFNAGNYFIRIVSAEGQVALKFVKQ